MRKILESKYFYLILILLSTVSYFFEHLLLLFVDNFYIINVLHIVFNLLFLILLLKFLKTKNFKDSEIRPKAAVYILLVWCVVSSLGIIYDFVIEASI
ncbi:MAG: hypothetical protein CSA38_00815 [Flavobacteriales bacterium]|nr:MAG: hypothetical protein CSA38_00815 [Flavobacteriales bacterium]